MVVDFVIYWVHLDNISSYESYYIIIFSILDFDIL
jgi:hypothetical protein